MNDLKIELTQRILRLVLSGKAPAAPPRAPPTRNVRFLCPNTKDAQTKKSNDTAACIICDYVEKGSKRRPSGLQQPTRVRGDAIGQPGWSAKGAALRAQSIARAREEPFEGGNAT